MKNRIEESFGKVKKDIDDLKERIGMLEKSQSQTTACSNQKSNGK